MNVPFERRAAWPRRRARAGSFRGALTALALCGVSAAVHAAPVADPASVESATSATDTAAPGARPARGAEPAAATARGAGARPETAPAMVGVPDATNASRAIDLLLEMQATPDRTAPRVASPASAPTPAPGKPAPSAADPRRAAGAPGLDLLSPAQRDNVIQASPGAGDGVPSRVGWSGGGSESGAGRRDDPAQGGEDDLLRRLLPADVLEFLREHRAALGAGAAVLLLAAWGVSALFAARR
jgi:hypothetical protein